MKDWIDKKTVEGIAHYGDAASVEFYRWLRERRFATTRCRRCAAIDFPPRSICPSCFSRELEWVDLPPRARLYAFTQQGRSLRFGKPDVLGLVEIEGLGKLLTRIDAPFESLRIGMEVEVDFLEVSPDLVVHQFRPVPPGAETDGGEGRGA